MLKKATIDRGMFLKPCQCLVHHQFAHVLNELMIRQGKFDDPEGSDVPMYLMRIEATEKKNWEALKTQLVEFGRNSGLFENIEVKNLERSLGAPFQLQVKVRGPKANIIDVGYGVSQILPILVQILNPSISKMLGVIQCSHFFLYYNNLKFTYTQEHKQNSPLY